MSIIKYPTCNDVSSGFWIEKIYMFIIYYSLREIMLFELQSSYKPAGDQIKAIEEIKKLFESGKNKATLL